MFHLTAAPQYSAPDAAHLAFTIVIATAFAAAASIILIFVGMNVYAADRERKGVDLNEKVDRFAKIALTVIAVGGLATVITGTVVGFNQTTAARAEHRTEIASWLSTEYGAKVNPDKLVEDRNSDREIIEVAATIDGDTRIIKLAPAPDGKIAAFQSDDQPLTKAGR